MSYYYNECGSLLTSKVNFTKKFNMPKNVISLGFHLLHLVNLSSFVLKLHNQLHIRTNLQLVLPKLGLRERGLFLDLSDSF